MLHYNALTRLVLENQTIKDVIISSDFGCAINIHPFSTNHVLTASAVLSQKKRINLVRFFCGYYFEILLRLRRIRMTPMDITLIFCYHIYMITYLQAIIIGFIQGISELFPISSLGHSVILPKLVGWNINQNDPFFLTFLVATHLATALVLFVFFWKDWINILKGLGRSLAQRQIKSDDTWAKVGWLLVVGTIPTGILGLLFKESLQSLFASPKIAALFLILNGAVLYGAEILRKKAPESGHESYQKIAKLSWWQAIKVGLSQILALIPGLSRSGSTMAGSLLVGLSNEDAARFSFLLATPIIGAAAALSLPDFLKPQNYYLIGPSLAGAVAAAIAAYFSVKFLVKYFHTNKLTPFAVYCAVAGVVYSVILYFR